MLALTSSHWEFLSRMRGISGIWERNGCSLQDLEGARICDDANPESLPAGDTMSLINFLQTLSEPLKPKNRWTCSIPICGREFRG
jgi:hypothetical protein